MNVITIIKLTSLLRFRAHLFELFELCEVDRFGVGLVERATRLLRAVVRQRVFFERAFGCRHAREQLVQLAVSRRTRFSRLLHSGCQLVGLSTPKC